MIHNTKPFLLGVFFSILAVPATADSDLDVGVGASISTLGYGADVTIKLTKQFNIRTTYRVADDAQDFEEGDFDYSVSMDSSATLLALDWHPLTTGVRFTAGVFAGSVKFEGESRCQRNSCDLGSGNYARLIVGDVTFNADTGSANPYLGIGYGNAAHGTGLGFSADLGVMINTNPSVTLRSSNESTTCAPGSPCDDDLQEEAKKLEDAFDIYPVIGIGISYTF